MPYKDMREFLDVLEKDDQLKKIDVPIKVAHGDNELQALMRLLCQNDGPGGHGRFKNFQRPTQLYE